MKFVTVTFTGTITIFAEEVPNQEMNYTSKEEFEQDLKKNEKNIRKAIREAVEDQIVSGTKQNLRFNDISIDPKIKIVNHSTDR